MLSAIIFLNFIFFAAYLISRIFGSQLNLLIEDLRWFFEKTQAATTRKIFHERPEAILNNQVAEKIFFSPNFVKLLSQQAGFKLSYRVFLFFSFLTDFFIVTILFFVSQFELIDIHPVFFILLSVVLLAGGLYVPHCVLIMLKRARIQTIERHIGAFIDLMLVCLDAGLTLIQSLEFVADEYHSTCPMLSRELRLTNLDASVHLDSDRAFINLLLRIPSQKVSHFVTLVQQQLNDGVLVHDSLHQMSIAIHRDNLALLSERAQKIPGTLSAIGIVFTLPIIFIVALGPYMADLMGFSGQTP